MLSVNEHSFASSFAIWMPFSFLPCLVPNFKDLNLPNVLADFHDYNYNINERTYSQLLQFQMRLIAAEGRTAHCPSRRVKMPLCIDCGFMIFLLVGGSFSNLTRADMKTPEPGMKVPWVGTDRSHRSSKLIYVTHWKISDLPWTSSSNLHVVLISMGIGFSRIVFFFFCTGLVGVFCSYALGMVLEKRQTKSWTQRTPESERGVA